jgi:serine/threonine protein kinase
MKIIEKIKIKEFNVLQSNIIQKISENDLFVKIRETFQNETKIYIVMEYLPRGDIYYYLKQKTIVFREDIIKTLVSEIVVGI